MKTLPRDWRTSPEGARLYREAQAQAHAHAQSSANATGMDYGLEANDLQKAWRVFMLPMRHNRQGHELWCEVVSSEFENRQVPGHGWRARV